MNQTHCKFGFVPGQGLQIINEPRSTEDPSSSASDNQSKYAPGTQRSGV